MDLLGRDAEASRLSELLAEPGARLVSLSGRPGVGKSAVVALVPGLVAAGTEVWTADVADAPPDADLLGEVVRVLGLAAASPTDPAGPEPVDRLAELVSHTRVVLVADHADSCVIDQASLRELLRRCEGLVVLVVTATPLREAAAELVLRPLRVSPPYARWEEIAASPSARLFTRRAESVTPGFRLDAATAESIAEICRLVGGLPLAIELAAARTGMLSLDRLARELGGEVALEILTPRAGPAQLSLRDALASTRRLLTPREDRLLSAVAAFGGPFTFDAAVGVADAPPGEVLDDLGSLIDLRLVEPIMEDRQEPSFTMLPLVRSFARAGSASQEADLDRRGMVLRALTRQAAEAAERAAVTDAVHAVRIMRYDVGEEVRRRATIDIESAAAMAVDAASVLSGYSAAAAIGEVLSLVIRSGTIATLDGACAGRVWLWASNTLAFSPDGAAMSDLVNERWRRGADLIDPAAQPHLALQARLIAIMNGSATGDLALAARAATEGRALAAEHALPAWLARFEVGAAVVAHAAGDSVAAAALGRSGLERGQRVGDALAIVAATVMLHLIAPTFAASGAAVPDLEDALGLAVALQDPMIESLVLVALARRDLDRGNPAGAALWCAQRLAEGRRRGWSDLAAISFAHAALIAVASGDWFFAARMVGVVRADQERTTRLMGRRGRSDYERLEGVIAARLGTANAARLVAAGGLLSTADATAEAVRWLEDHGTVPIPAAPAQVHPLTVREQDVLELLADGMTNKQIAEQLHLSVKTVMHHSVAIYRKLGVRGRAEATATAYRYGLLRRTGDARGA